jgi:predicted MFS family arabinose efflux permease
VVSGILTGILASRTISGLVAGAAGWRAIYVLAAGAAIAFALLLYRAIPPLAPKTRMAYPALIASVVSVALRERSVRWTLVLSATGFGVFTMFWTALTFLLSSPPFSYPVSVIGLFGLAGLAGAIAAQRSGLLHDRGWSLPATGTAWAAVLLSFVLAMFGGRSVVLVIVVVVVLDIALQVIGILNQLRVFAVSHEARKPAQHRVRDDQLRRRGHRLGRRNGPVDRRWLGRGEHRRGSAQRLRPPGLGRRTTKRARTGELDLVGR